MLLEPWYCIRCGKGGTENPAVAMETVTWRKREGNYPGNDIDAIAPAALPLDIALFSSGLQKIPIMFLLSVFAYTCYFRNLLYDRKRKYISVCTEIILYQSLSFDTCCESAIQNYKMDFSIVFN